MRFNVKLNGGTCRDFQLALQDAILIPSFANHSRPACIRTYTHSQMHYSETIYCCCSMNNAPVLHWIACNSGARLIKCDWLLLKCPSLCSPIWRPGYLHLTLYTVCIPSVSLTPAERIWMRYTLRWNATSSADWVHKWRHSIKCITSLLTILSVMTFDYRYR